MATTYKAEQIRFALQRLRAAEGRGNIDNAYMEALHLGANRRTVNAIVRRKQRKARLIDPGELA